MFGRIREMLIKEFIQVFRDPQMSILIFIPPILQLIVFGYAASTDVKNIATAIYDLDHSIESRELVSRLAASGYFDILYHVNSPDQITRLIDENKISTAIQFNKGFSEKIRGNQTAVLQVIVDGTDSNTASVVLNYGGKIIQNYSSQILLERIARQSGISQEHTAVEDETRIWFNENLESQYFYVPGLLAIIIMLITFLLTSMAVVREKEIGTMEQIMVTPITSAEFILGKTVPFAIIGFMDMILIVTVATLWFQVPIRGSLAVLFLSTFFYILSSLGFGLLISTISKTQQQAMMTTFFFFFPATLLSGFTFPIENMPVVVQWLTYLNPMRYFLIIVRGIFLKGIGLDILWHQIGALAVIGIVTLWLASKRLHKTLT
ncbi:MAG: ABC transporter permease [Phycisphaerae bacterium]|jgi:ABC-2 type transport system permease protein|nr:ABC transporter permease [Phycisphaerae bacterium]